jgi:hypothetical protein
MFLLYVQFGRPPPALTTWSYLLLALQGSIFSCNRKAKNPADRVKYVLNGHHGPIYGLRRNPFNSKYFMSIGDWTARVWTDDTAVKTPILTTKYHATYLTGGTNGNTGAPRCVWLRGGMQQGSVCTA